MPQYLRVACIFYRGLHNGEDIKYEEELPLLPPGPGWNVSPIQQEVITACNANVQSL